MGPGEIFYLVFITNGAICLAVGIWMGYRWGKQERLNTKMSKGE